MNEDTKERRTPSPQSLALRAERTAMLPFRKRIGQLQSQVALIAARALSTKTVDRNGIRAAYQFVDQEIERTLADIDTVTPGAVAGPAEDCRRALRMLETRLPR